MGPESHFPPLATCEQSAEASPTGEGADEVSRYVSIFDSRAGHFRGESRGRGPGQGPLVSCGHTLCLAYLVFSETQAGNPT